MIKNEKQYRMAKKKLDRWLKTLAQLLERAPSATESWLADEQAFGVRQEIEQLRAEITDYEETVSGKKNLPDLAVVAEIPHLLIRWRIARGLTQRELAKRLDVHENQIQKYEAENYSGASLHTITEIARILRDEQEGSTDRTQYSTG